MPDQDGPNAAVATPLSARANAAGLIALFGVVVAGRLAFSLDRRIFHLIPDEPATLAMARWLSGGGKWDMFNNSTWRPGMATLLAPVFWATDDQDTIMRSALIIGALLGGAAAVITALLIRRLTGLSGVRTLIVAGGVALTPASLSASAHVWAEPLVTVTVLMTLWSLLNFYDDSQIGRGLVALAWSVVGYTSHGRLLLLVLIATLAVAGKLVAQRRWTACVGVVVPLGAATLASTWYAQSLVDALWTEPGERNTVGSVLARFSNPAAIVESAVGQIWYLLVSTLGLAAIGTVVLVGRLAKPDQAPAVRRDALIVLAVITPLVLLSILFMSDRDRSDQLIYGRYNDAVMWPILAVGASWTLARLGTRWRQLGRPAQWLLAGMPSTMLFTGALIHLAHHDQFGVSAGIIEMIPGLIPALGSSGRLNVLAVTGLAAGSFGLLVATMMFDRWRGLIIVPLAAGLLGLAGVATHSRLSNGLNFGEGARAAGDIDPAVLPPGVEIVYGLVPESLDPGASAFTQNFYAHAYQWYLPERSIRVISTGDYPPAGFVFAPIRDLILLGSSAETVWIDPDVGIALWATTSDPNTEPAATDTG